MNRTFCTAAIVAAAALSGCASPADPGTPAEQALACTLPSNCVTTLDGGAAPLNFSGDAARAQERLRQVLAGDPGARIVRSDATSLDTVFTTALGFEDEVSFRIDVARQRIDFRSRSRLGLFDFGKNRSRMREFAARFAAVGG